MSELSDNMISVTRYIVSIANNEHPRRRIEVLQMPQLCIRDSGEAGNNFAKRQFDSNGPGYNRLCPKIECNVFANK